MPEKIKIVHVLEGFAGGAATYIDNTLIRLKDRGFDVTFICSLDRTEDGSEERIEKLRRLGVKVHIVDMRREIKIIADVQAFIAILKIFRKNRFDIVHSHCSKAGALSRVAALIAGIKVRIHSPHCFAFIRCGGALSKRVYLALEKILAAITTKLVLVGKGQKEIAEKYKIASAQKCEVVQNGLDTKTVELSDAEKAAYKKQLGIGSNCRVVATVCRLTGYKGVGKFIEAAELSKIKDVVFVIAGQGQLRRQIEKTITEKNLSKKVLLLGQLRDMDRLYGICDAVVLCSQAEGQSYVILEAMRSSCAIVASSVIGNIELLDEARGVLVENKVEHIAAGIDSILSDKEKQQQMRDRAYEYFLKNHNVERQIDKLSRIYKSAVRKIKL
ncbi:MAG: glycosyltransferase [Planctomycetes bacterium]|nr:glycosyltransferase [Planctomycetota bacterium]